MTKVWRKSCAMICVMSLGCRKMGCLIDVTDEAFVDDDRRAVWMGMALRHAQSLPPKP